LHRTQIADRLGGLDEVGNLGNAGDGERDVILAAALAEARPASAERTACASRSSTLSRRDSRARSYRR